MVGSIAHLPRWSDVPVQMEREANPAAVEVLLIGGRSGAGKTSVGFEVSARLQAVDVWHCLVDGDNLDAVYPKPDDDPYGTRITETNLRSLWTAYAALGHHRMIYVNTSSVLSEELIRRAVSPDVVLHGVLLTASDDTVGQRLRRREIGSTLVQHLQFSAARDAQLRATAPSWVVRVPTDARPLAAVVSDVIAITGWITVR